MVDQMLKSTEITIEKVICILTLVTLVALIFIILIFIDSFGNPRSRTNLDIVTSLLRNLDHHFLLVFCVEISYAFVEISSNFCYY